MEPVPRALPFGHCTWAQVARGLPRLEYKPLQLPADVNQILPAQQGIASLHYDNDSIKTESASVKEAEEGQQSESVARSQTNCRNDELLFPQAASNCLSITVACNADKGSPSQDKLSLHGHGTSSIDKCLYMERQHALAAAFYDSVVVNSTENKRRRLSAPTTPHEVARVRNLNEEEVACVSALNIEMPRGRRRSRRPRNKQPGPKPTPTSEPREPDLPHDQIAGGLGTSRSPPQVLDQSFPPWRPSSTTKLVLEKARFDIVGSAEAVNTLTRKTKDSNDQRKAEFKQEVHAKAKAVRSDRVPGSYVGQVDQNSDRPEAEHNRTALGDSRRHNSWSANHALKWDNPNGVDVVITCRGLQWGLHREILLLGAPAFVRRCAPPAQADKTFVFWNLDRHEPAVLSNILKFMYVRRYEDGYFKPDDPLDPQVVTTNAAMYIAGASVLCEPMMRFAESLVLDMAAKLEGSSAFLNFMDDMVRIDAYYDALCVAVDQIKAQPRQDLMRLMREALVKLLSVTVPLVGAAKEVNLEHIRARLEREQEELAVHATPLNISDISPYIGDSC